MPNRNAPYGSRYRGWFYDALNGRLEYYYNGTKVGHLDANGMSITNDTTARMTNGVVTLAGSPTEAESIVVRIGTNAAIASNGAGAITPDVQFVAPWAGQIISAWSENISASDVTKGTATTSASYRRYLLVTNTAGTGSGTDIVASLNATASLASNATRAWTTVASTVPAGALVLGSHLTVGAETGDGTDAAARIHWIVFQAV